MRKIWKLALCILICSFITGCKSEMTVGKEIREEDISEFYFTRENINFNASYQRYHFYTENGKHLLYHETRKRENEYGPTNENDITFSGTVELTDEEWMEFYAFLKDGTVKKRGEPKESGSRGPWLYLYWKNDKSEYQEYTFSSPDKLLAFEDFCIVLAERSK